MTRLTVLALACVLVGTTLERRATAADDPVAAKAELVRALRARETALRAGVRVRAVSLQWDKVDRGPVLISHVDADFFGAAERWTHRKEQEGITAPIVLPSLKNLLPGPLPDAPGWLPEFLKRASPVVDVCDGGRHLTVNRVEEHRTGWFGQLNAELDRFARRGEMFGWLMWSEDWLSRAVEKWELAAADYTGSARESTWLFVAGRTANGIEHRVRMRCAAESQLPIEFVWTVTPPGESRTPTTPPRPQVPIEFGPTETLKKRISVTACVRMDAGISIPRVVKSEAAYGLTGPCHTLFEAVPLSADERDARRFDPRLRPIETGDDPLTVYDAVTNEMLIHGPGGAVERRVMPAETGSDEQGGVAARARTMNWALGIGVIACGIAVLAWRRRRAR